MEAEKPEAIQLDDVTKERWIKQMQEDYPQVDRLMCEMLISKWCEDSDWFDKVERGEIVIPKKTERNTEYCYKGVNVE
jgi:hypothetical protein